MAERLTQSSAFNRRSPDGEGRLFDGFDESAFDEVDVSVGPAGDLAFGATTAVRVDSNGRDGSLIKGALAGVIAGAFGSLVMNEFQALWSRLAEARPSSGSAGGRHDAREWQERSEDENANELVAQEIAEATIERRLSKNELKVTGPAVHYAFGSAMGALYGAAAETFDGNAMTGAAWGTLLWIGADEVAVPAFGLSKAPASYSLETHAQAFAAHIVYGVTTEIVRKLVRSAL